MKNIKLPRRDFASLLMGTSLGTIVTSLATGAHPSPANARQDLAKNNQPGASLTAALPEDLTEKIVALFQDLPGKTALKLHTVSGQGGWEITDNAQQALFCGSAFKVYVLTVFLRQMEAGLVSLNDPLTVDDRVRALSSAVFGDLTGQTTALIALEAMIMHSDNTATDLILALVTPQAVRRFIADIGLTQTAIPDSINVMLSYLLGAEDGEDWGWDKINQMQAKSTLNDRQIINDQQTMTASAEDFVNFYRRALRGEFFSQATTLGTFKRILALPRILGEFVPPWAWGYGKGGSLDWNQQQALCLAGGIHFSPSQWTFYSFLINWDNGNAEQNQAVARQFLAAVQASLQLTQNLLTDRP